MEGVASALGAERRSSRKMNRKMTMGAPLRDANEQLVSMATSRCDSVETPKAALTFIHDDRTAVESVGTLLEEIDDSESIDVAHALDDNQGTGAVKRFSKRAVVKPDNTHVH